MEELRIEDRGEGELALHYEQQTWLVDENGQRDPSHWESGFITLTDEGVLEILNAQTSVRVEVLRGDLSLKTVDGGEATLHLQLASCVHAHDPRMKSSVRSYWLRPNNLRYEVLMVTDTVPELTQHLSAELTRLG